MLNGHGDDTYKYPDIRINFSSNVYNHFKHDGLYAYLAERMDCVRNYPEPTPISVEQEIAESYGINPDEVMVTNGATEAIYLIAQAFSKSTSYVIQPTFTEYADACRLHGHEVIDIANLGDIHPSNITRHPSPLIWLCNPNNPTGKVTPKPELISAFTAHPEVLFIVDESYSPFTNQPLVGSSMSAANSNVIILHSMTKEFAVPGIRLGYVTGPSAILEKIRAIRMPWSVNQFAIEAAHYLLAHHRDYTLDIKSMMAERERVSQAINAINGFTVLPSDTHMLLCRIEVGRHAIAAPSLRGRAGGEAASLKADLAVNHGILIRDASNFVGLDERYFRIAIQTPEENNELINALKQWITLHTV